MAGFNCTNCGFDLSLRIDLMALAVKADYPDGDYPEDLTLDGMCEKCDTPFSYAGEMFTHFITSKVEEGIINPETNDYAILEFSVSPEELEEFRCLLKKGDRRKLQEFVSRLMFRDID